MTDLTALIEKLERASEGSREIDCLIACECHVAPPDAPEWLRKNFSQYAPSVGIPGNVAAMHTDGREGVNWIPTPFSSSLDAARYLIDHVMADLGCPMFTVQTDFRHDSRDDFCSAEITVSSREFQGRAMGKDAQARAWCAAALRAKANYPERVG